MLTHKQCPKCHGNIYLSADYYGRYEQCLQCGYTNDLDAIEDHTKKVAPRKEKAITV
jgi:ribosomal protein S27AE